jgi:alkylated DNA repair dioxygenase AlkB
MRIGPLPSWALGLANRLASDGYMPGIADQLIVNEYMPGQGIAPHVDCVPCFEDGIVSVSLGSPVEMEFLRRGEETRRVLLDPRSAVVLRGPARFDWAHTIRPRLSDRASPRSRRVSLTFRRVIVGPRA